MSRINAGNLLWMLLVHMGAIAAPLYFTWSAFTVFLVLTLVTGLGITLGFHRLLTHASFKTYPVVRFIIALIGTLAGEGPPTVWVATHRQHHQYSDREGDPHSPFLGGFPWAQWLWMVPRVNESELINRYAPDLSRDRGMIFLHRAFLPLHIIFASLLFAIGGLPWLMWGIFFRIAFVLETTWLVNSVTHMVGYRNYDTADHSTNFPPVALLTFGEGWHNNHHAFPRAADHGHKWFEFDLTYRLIQVMEKVGLAWDVVKHDQ